VLFVNDDGIHEHRRGVPVAFIAWETLTSLDGFYAWGSDGARISSTGFSECREYRER
jgi:hypothetical protein